MSLVTISSSVSRLINAEEMREREKKRCDSKKKMCDFHIVRSAKRDGGPLDLVSDLSKVLRSDGKVA